MGHRVIFGGEVPEWLNGTLSKAAVVRLGFPQSARYMNTVLHALVGPHEVASPSAGPHQRAETNRASPELNQIATVLRHHKYAAEVIATLTNTSGKVIPSYQYSGLLIS